MKRLIPRRNELLILFVMALACAALASASFKQDVALSVGAMPLFVASCLLGMRRNGQLSRRDESTD
jgi:hypothetical protein